MAQAGSLTGPTAWVNVRAYGATGNGVTDDSAAIQAAMTALAAAGGGTLYIPAGSYVISATLAWISPKSLLIQGDGKDATQIIRNSATAPFHTWDIQNVSGGVTVRDLNIVNAVNAGSFADDQVGLYFGACNRVRLQNVHINSSADRVNIAVELQDVNTASIISCDLRGYVNALLFSGGTVVVDCIASAFYTNSGSGQANAANIAMISSAGTLHVTNCETNGGDHGLVCQGGNPDAFVFIHDFEINNPVGHGIVLNSGSEFWANQLWASDQGVPYSSGAYYGISVGSSYQGWVVIDNSTFQHWAGHGVYIGGGQSYWIANSSFSGCCGNAANTYDDIHVVAGVSEVTIEGCHFEVEPFNAIQAPRSGVYLESGVTNYQVSNNIFAATGWGTGSCVDANTPAQRLGFTNNLHGFNYKDAAAVANLGNVGTTETIVVQLQIDPQDLLANATFRLKLIGTYTNGSASATNSLRLRAGTAGTLSDTQVIDLSSTSNSATDSGTLIDIDALFVLTAPGSSGSGAAEMRALQNAAGYGTTPTVFVSGSLAGWNTTIASWLTLSFQTSNASNTLAVTVATLEKVV